MRILARLFYIWVQFVGRIVVFCPRALKVFFVKSLALTWFHVVGFRKKVIIHNLLAVFPKLPQESSEIYKNRMSTLVLKNMEHMIWILIEILERAGLSPQHFRSRYRIHQAEIVEDLKNKGQGFFILSAHLGNWEVATYAGVLLGLRLAIITRFLRNPFFDELWICSRKEFGLELLKESGSGLGIVRAVREGKAVGFILDQHTGQPHGIEAKFMGKKAWCPKGLAILSERLKVPVVPAYFVRDAHQKNDGVTDIFVGKPLEFPHMARFRSESGALSEEGMVYHIEVCNENMEQWIRRYPEQYNWMHKRFKNLIDYRGAVVWL